MCPVRDCTHMVPVYQYDTRSDDPARRRFGGRLYLVCPDHGRYEGQEYLLCNAKLSSPGDASHASSPQENHESEPHDSSQGDASATRANQSQPQQSTRQDRPIWERFPTVIHQHQHQQAKGRQ